MEWMQLLLDMGAKLWILVILAIIAGSFWVAMSGFRMVRNLKAGITQMHLARKASYPENELPLQLQTKPDGSTIPATMASWQPVTPPAHEQKVLLDVDEERLYPYYKRTHNILSNRNRYSDTQLANHTWYHDEEWIQDMIANKVSEECLAGKKK